MSENKRILVLSYNDNPAEGQAYSRYKELKDKGYEVYFVSLLSCYNGDGGWFYKIDKRFSFRYTLRNAFFRLINAIFKSRANRGEYCFYNTLNIYEKSAKTILKKSIPNPDIIILGWYDYFISPRVLWDLYNLTKAKIVIPMIDAHLLGGGCHYPCDCEQYSSGCKNCPALIYRGSARSLYKAKIKYLTQIPFTIAGSGYDLKRANNVPFLRNKEMIPTLGAPEIPFTMSKEKAREFFNIPKDDFVILCGVHFFSEKRKGFYYTAEAIKHFMGNKSSGRKITLLMLGNGEIPADLQDLNINIVKPGYLPLKDLYIAYFASNLFISSSIDDSGPYMVNYSIACGVPVVSFPIGIALDLVIPTSTGYLAKYLDYKDLSNGILHFYELGKDEEVAISQNCLRLMDDIRENYIPWYIRAVN